MAYLEEGMKSVINGWSRPVSSVDDPESLDNYKISYSDVLKVRGDYSNFGISIRRIPKRLSLYIDVIRIKDGMQMAIIHKDNTIVYNCPGMPTVLASIVKNNNNSYIDEYFN